jgi:long-chain acyl-CoA synthetase
VTRVPARVERLAAADAERRQRRAAAALHALGFEAGDRLALVGPGSADYLCVVLGALRVGIVPVVLNPALLESERQALLADADVRLVLGAGDAERLVREAAEEVALADAPLARPMHYTSGTTGVPKGVWSGLLEEHEARALLAEEQELWGFGSADVHLCAAPLHHSAPIRFSAGVLLAGGEVVVVAPFVPDAVARAVVEHRPTTTFLAPAHLQRLLALEVPPGFGSFRLVAHAGAPCPAPLKERVIERCPDGSVWEFYGSTEGQFTACSSVDWQARPGTVGRARPGRDLTVDADGTIWCGIPPFARFEYWRDPAKTAAAVRTDADGATRFTVGDLGRLDDDGFLYLDGRRDDLIISGGVNVYPAEVERVLHTAPGVVDAAVFGVEDERWGQRVCAAVTGAGVTAEAVIAHARGQLAAYKCPKQVVVVEEIPVTPTGKVRRSTLADDLGIA